jgi:hypothetical protein
MKRRKDNIIVGLLSCMMSYSFWISSTHPCILFFGEYEYPKKENYPELN